MLPVIALKVDVDTFIGTRDGVPALLDLFRRFGIRGTFYFSLGPDNSGKAIRRIFTRKGFLAKMIRTRAPSVYGLRTLLYGTLLPPPMIGARSGEIIRRTEQEGHEVGIHCWDHVKWHDYLPRMLKPTVALEMGQASAVYEEIFGHRTKTVAAPGWMVSAASLEVQDALKLEYSSDSRGRAPFYPVWEGRRFRTLQLPTTLPTTDELLGENGITTQTLNDHYLSLITPGLNVLTIHAELEGKATAAIFVDLLERLTALGCRFITLAEAAVEFGKGAPDSPLSMGEIEGRAGVVALQGT